MFNYKEFRAAAILFFVMAGFLFFQSAKAIETGGTDSVATSTIYNNQTKPSIPKDDFSRQEKKQIIINKNKYDLNIITIDLNKNVEIITDTATTTNCQKNCPAKPLADYVKENKAFAGIHGSYFCPPDYAACSGKKYYYFYPFYSTKAKTLVNEDQLKWPTTGPLLVFTKDNEIILFNSTRDFKNLKYFQDTFKKEVQAIIGNQPALVKNGKAITRFVNLDAKQRSVKGNRGAIGVKGKKVMLVASNNATISDMAKIMESLKVDFALNLDGGGSTAMYYNGRYLVGPGRLLPNAILFRKK